MFKLPSRHICLDFHTSPLIPDVGAAFVRDEFASTLSRARVNAVTLHAKCHHGYSYYPTKIGRMHPGLGFDLFGEMVSACHSVGIAVEGYLSVAWDELAASEHADWLQVEKGGKLAGRNPVELNDCWRYLCLNSPYADYLSDQTAELLRSYQVEGMLFDIVCQIRPGCLCNHCLDSMRRLNFHPGRDADLIQHSLLVERNFMDRISRQVWAVNPDATIWFNARVRLENRPEMGIRPELRYLSHIELESLPSGLWGYNHFPMYARHLQTLGMPIKGQTGRFHKSWGDFGGLKNQAALAYECCSMLANGATCSIGDQMHPRARLDPAVYERIGRVYGQVEAKEPYCLGAVPEAEVAVLSASRGEMNTLGSESDEGAFRMLSELQAQFQIVDRLADFHAYRLLLMPDFVRVDEELRAKIAAFLHAGGGLIASMDSGLWADRDEFALPQWGLTSSGPYPFTPCYFQVESMIAKDIEPMEHVLYEQGRGVTPVGETEVLARLFDPYFNRTWDHFSGHAQTPVDKASGYPALTKRGRVIYAAHPFFQAYLRHGNRVYKSLIRNCMELLLPDPLMRIQAPSTARATLLRQDRESRLIAHILHYIPERRTKSPDISIDIVEEAIPLYQVELKVRMPAEPARVFLAPQEIDIEHRWDGKYAVCRVPEVNGHQMVVFQIC